MSYHAVLAFPDDDDATLEKVLRKTRTGAVSSPLSRCVTFAHENDALLARLFGGRIVDRWTLVLDSDEEAELRGWLKQNPIGHTEWFALERFEFFRQSDAARVIEAFELVTGRKPCLMSLDLWPEIFTATI